MFGTSERHECRQFQKYRNNMFSNNFPLGIEWRYYILGPISLKVVPKSEISIGNPNCFSNSDSVGSFRSEYVLAPRTPLRDLGPFVCPLKTFKEAYITQI